MRLPDPARSRALLLGTSVYSDAELPNLPMVGNNLAGLAQILTSPWATALPRQHCVVLPDEVDRGVIGTALSVAARQAEDLLLVYYAGHGLIGEDGALYLSLPNTRSDRDMVSWTALPFELLRNKLARARADNRVLILDCCFSGLAIDLMGDVASAVSGQIAVAGTCTLTSSPANRPSSAPAAAQYTAYTGELLDILRRGPSDSGTELLTLTAIHEHLERVLPSRGFPRPEQRNTRTIGRLALARRPPATVNQHRAQATSSILDGEAGSERLEWAIRIAAQTIVEREPDSVTPATQAGVGPYGSDESIGQFHISRGHLLDLGSVLIPVPKDGQLQVEMTPEGTPQAVHIALEHGRITVAAYAAPSELGQWRSVADDLAAHLRMDDATVSEEYGPWGPEIFAVTKGADIRFIGADGFRWMMRVVVAGPSGAVDQVGPLVRKTYRVLSETVVRRGTELLPPRTPLPVILPTDLAKQLATVHQQQVRDRP